MQRFDAALITGVTERTNEGFLRAKAIVTRTGIFKYRNADGTMRRELRLPEHIFAADSLDTIKQIPVTLGHPPVWVDKDNAAEYMKGMTGETVEHDDQSILCSITITHADAIRAIESGLQRQLSLGYDLNLVPEPGTYNGEEYDAIQTNIRYNHLAIVNRARAGEVATLRMDQAEMVDDSEPTKAVDHIEEVSVNTNKGSLMKTIHIDGVDHEVGDAVSTAYAGQVVRADKAESEVVAMKSAVEADKARADKAEAEVAAANTTVTALTAERDTEKGRADGLADEVAKLKAVDHAEALESAVQARLSLLDQARKAVDGETFDAIKGKSSREIMSAVIAKHSDGFSDEGKSDEYVVGRFDSIVSLPVDEKRADAEALKKQESNFDNEDGCGKGGAKGEEMDSMDCEAAKTRQDKNMTEAWRTKGAGKAKC
jgi:hypothetical protein